MKKIYDLAVKNGEYQKNGETKFRWLNVGSMVENEKGKFIFLDKTFNPAGVESNGNNSIIVSMFQPKGSNNSQSDPFSDGGIIDDPWRE